MCICLRQRRRLAGVAAMVAAVLISGGSRAADLSAPDSLPDSLKDAPDAAADLPKQAPAPLGVFGASLPDQGQFQISAVGGYARSDGSLIGTASVTPQWAATHVYTTYSPKGVGVPQPVRNDPLDVDVWAEGLGVTYGVTQDLALTVASSYVEKHQDVEVFAGTGSFGANVKGITSPSTEGIGDTAVAGVWRVYRDSMNQVNVNMGLSLPTGSDTLETTTMNNSGAMVTKRAVYTLQIGSGTVDALPGIVYSGVLDQWSWGLSYRARLPLDNNSQGYRWGDYHEVNGWGGYSWLPGLETTLRLSGSAQGAIHGYDPEILGYGPCSNPLWFGGEHIDLFPGLTVSGKYLNIPAATFAMEGGVPLYQNLNGLHTARDYTILSGLKFKF